MNIEKAASGRPRLVAVDFESDTLVAEAGQFEPNSAGLRYLHEMTSRQGRMSVILGPPNSGKTEVIKRFAKNLSGDRVCKVLNARLLTPESLIAACLQSMQYGASRLSSDEMLDLLRVVVSQQARGKKAPILIVDDMQDMTPLAQQTLCSLAGFTNQRHPAIHIVLAGEPGCARLLASPAMAALAARATEVFHLEPLSPTEVRHYLHGRLRASGVRLPDTVFPLDVCESLHEQSGGWLGSLNRCASNALADSGTFESAPRILDSKATLILTRGDAAISAYEITGEKTLIGRSMLADLRLDDHLVSKYQALLFQAESELIVADLNSANGTTVNSARIVTCQLKDGDVIGVGQHEITVHMGPAPAGTGSQNGNKRVD